MSTFTAARYDLRALQRRATDPLTVLDDIARIGFEGTQFGVDFPEGAAPRDADRSQESP
jgi:hypothetical protein